MSHAGQRSLRTDAIPTEPLSSDVSEIISCHQTPSFPRMQDLQEGKAFSLHRGQETVVSWRAIMKRSLVGLLDQRLLFFPSMLCGVLGCSGHGLSAAGMSVLPEPPCPFP